MFVLARIVVLALMLTPVGGMLYKLIHLAAETPGIGTALLTLVMCSALMAVVNRAWPRDQAALWLYDRGVYNALESLFITSLLGGLEPVPARRLPNELWHRLRSLTWLRRSNAREPVDDSSDEPTLLPVMIALKDRKVYVGWLQWVPPLRDDGGPFVRIQPVWSGYRDKDTLKVVPTNLYQPIREVTNGRISLLKVIPVAEISSANLYDEAVFSHFNKDTSDDGPHVEQQ